MVSQLDFYSWKLRDGRLLQADKCYCWGKKQLWLENARPLVDEMTQAPSTLLLDPTSYWQVNQATPNMSLGPCQIFQMQVVTLRYE